MMRKYPRRPLACCLRIRSRNFFFFLKKIHEKNLMKNFSHKQIRTKELKNNGIEFYTYVECIIQFNNSFVASDGVTKIDDSGKWPGDRQSSFFFFYSKWSALWHLPIQRKVCKCCHDLMRWVWKILHSIGLAIHLFFPNREDSLSCQSLPNPKDHELRRDSPFINQEGLNSTGLITIGG